MGLVDGVTTNPTLLAKEGEDTEKLIRKIWQEVRGPVNVEVIGITCEEMVKEAKTMATWGDEIVIKIPITPEGLKTVKILSSEGIRTNVTLLFSASQAILAAKAGATYVCPFLGRLDDISTNGLELIRQIRGIYENYPDIETQIIVASVRHPIHVIESGRMGAEIVTIPPAIIEQMVKHPLTDKGIAQFLEDAKKIGTRE
jgi:transaldolase